jgi:hypothetical protein
VWKNAYSENTSRKVWAAKYTARHPSLVALELSNFKCGHDAPIYSVVEEIIECSGTPYFSFKDLDENRPAGSIKIRVETIGYFLKRYREDKVRERGARRARARHTTRAHRHAREPPAEPQVDAAGVLRPRLRPTTTWPRAPSGAPSPDYTSYPLDRITFSGYLGI